MGNFYEKLYSEIHNDELEQNSQDICQLTEAEEENIEKNIENVCHNFLDSYSIELNNKNQKIMETTKLTKAELDRIAVRFNEIHSAVAASTTLSVKDQLTTYYLSASDNLSQTEAEQTVGRLMSGVDSLTDKYYAALNDGWNPTYEVMQMTADMDLQQRYDFLINAIAIAQSINAQNLGGDIAEMKSAVEAAIASLTADHSVVNEDVCKTLETLLCQLLESSSLMLQDSEQVKELMAAAGKGQTAAVDFAAATYDDRLYKYQMALAAWIEFENGNLESFPKNTIPEAVGVSVAAGIEEAKIVQEVSLGHKCVEWGVKCLKILGGVALACFLGYVGIVGLTISALSFFSAGVMIVGTSTAGIIVSGLAALLITCGLCDTVLEVSTKIMEGCSVAYDYVVDKLANDVFPAIKELATRFVAWVRSLFITQKQTQTSLS